MTQIMFETSWDRDELGRHGKDLAPHLLQRAAVQSRGSPYSADRGAAEPEGEPGADDADHVRDLQRAGDVRCYSGRFVALRLGAHDRDRDGRGRRGFAHGADLRGVRAPARDLAVGPGW